MNIPISQVTLNNKLSRKFPQKINEKRQTRRESERNENSNEKQRERGKKPYRKLFHNFIFFSNGLLSWRWSLCYTLIFESEVWLMALIFNQHTQTKKSAHSLAAHKVEIDL